MMSLLLIALGLYVFFGIAALIAQSYSRVSDVLGMAGAVLGSTLAIIPSVTVLFHGGELVWRHAWNVPGGSLYLALDPISGFFLVPITLLTALGAIYGTSYLRGHDKTRSLGAHWFFYNLLAASMVLVVLARNALLFLMVWEVMALASFFLVTLDDEKEEVRAAGWTYLIATHLGSAFLIGMFALMAHVAGSLDFDQFSVTPFSPHVAGIVFLLAMVGFGTKAGFVPFHVWLPEAHPAAPSHVSALMSGVMIKTGIYGIVRILLLLPLPAAWWGWTLVGVGLACGLFGVLFALAQQDLKRLLAYCSVENIGIICLGLGVGVLGITSKAPAVALLGFAGALLHVLNHALFKGLLFLGAGNILHATETANTDTLGGLLKRMPQTGFCFLIGSAAIAGLPPLNGFLSEFLIFLGAFQGIGIKSLDTAAPLLGVIIGLALMSGLAAAVFAKAFGIVFLGQPRSEKAEQAHEAPFLMLAPMFILAAACLAIGLLAPFIFRVLVPTAGLLTRFPHTLVMDTGRTMQSSFLGILCISLIVVCVTAGLTVLRRLLLARRTVGESGTWDCGYAVPTVRMQYTGTSFVQPLTALFKTLLRMRTEIAMPQALFPKYGTFTTSTVDLLRERFYRPIFETVGRAALAFRRLQYGTVHLYVLYIAITLIVLLAWKLR